MTREKDLNEVIAGEDKTYSLTITEDGSPKDVSSWSFEMTIVQREGRDVVVGSADIDTSNAASGDITINLNADQTSKLLENSHDYKIETTKGNGKKTVLFYGEIPVRVIGDE